MLVEKIVDEAEDFDVLVDLIRGVQVHDPVSGDLGIEVEVVMNKPLAADDVEVGAKFPDTVILYSKPALKRWAGMAGM